MRNPFTLSTAASFLWMSWYLLGVMRLLPAVEAADGTCTTTTSVCASCNYAAGYYLTCGTCAECSTTCSPNTYNTGPCTDFADLQCTLCTQCVNQVTYQTTACQAGGDITQNRVCSPCSTCGAGTYRTALCNTGANTQCAACTTCTAGVEYETTACQANGDPGTNRVCTACTVCTADQYESVPCSGTTNRVCLPCGNCPNGEYLASPCDGGPADCQKCSTCLEGQYESTRCGVTTDTVCSNCAICDPDTEYESQACTAVTDRVCKKCSTGPCPPGQYQSSNCTATSDRVCSPCTICGGNQYQTQACTETSNTECETCTACGATEWASTACQDEGEILFYLWKKFEKRGTGLRRIDNMTRCNYTPTPPHRHHLIHPHTLFPLSIRIFTRTKRDPEPRMHRMYGMQRHGYGRAVPNPCLRYQLRCSVCRLSGVWNH